MHRLIRHFQKKKYLFRFCCLPFLFHFFVFFSVFLYFPVHFPFIFLHSFCISSFLSILFFLSFFLCVCLLLATVKHLKSCVHLTLQVEMKHESFLYLMVLVLVYSECAHAAFCTVHLTVRLDWVSVLAATTGRQVHVEHKLKSEGTQGSRSAEGEW